MCLRRCPTPPRIENCPEDSEPKTLDDSVAVEVDRHAATRPLGAELRVVQATLPWQTVRGFRDQQLTAVPKQPAKARSDHARLEDPACVSTCTPGRLAPVRVTTLMTAKNALAAESEEPGPRMTSTRSISEMSIGKSAPIGASGRGKCAGVRIRTRVR